MSPPREPDSKADERAETTTEPPLEDPAAAPRHVGHPGPDRGPRRPPTEATQILHRSRPVRLDETPGFGPEAQPELVRLAPAEPGYARPASQGDDDPGRRKTLNEAPDKTLAERVGLVSLATPVALLNLPGERAFAVAPTAKTGHYHLGEVLGEGGMGRVHAAKDLDLGRTVALKTLREEHRGSPAYIQALVFEARLTGQLEHPNIVPVHELGALPDGSPYYTMKLVGDLSLQDVLRQLREGRTLATKHYTRNRLLQYFRGICMAVEYAHARGVIHRDLKPDNVLIGDYGEVQILDWGVARVLPHDGRPSYFAGRIEESGVVVGTPHYMSPEQARGDTQLVDARSDVYSLGVILYQLLTHTLPFAKTTTVEQLDALLSEEVTPPSRRAPEKDIPPALEAICMKALAPRRADRYGSARAVWEDIEAFLEGERERERLRELADALTAEADSAAGRFYRASEELLGLEAEVAKDDLNARHLDPLDQKKAAWERRLLADERRMVEARLFAEAVTGFQRALAYVPGHPAARSRLVELYRHRAQLARIRGDVSELILYSDLARAIDPPPPDSSGRINIRSYPEGAEIRILELRSDGAQLAVQTTAPAVDLRLRPGSYLVCASLPAHAERRETVVIEPNGTEQVLLSLSPWDSALPVVARGDDLTAIREAFNAVMAERRLGSLMVTGEAGLGKRKLLDEFGSWLDRLPQIVVYGAVRMDPIHRHVPFHAIAELLAHRAGIGRADSHATMRQKLLDMVRRPWMDELGDPDGELPTGVSSDLETQAALLARLPQFRDPDEATNTAEPVSPVGPRALEDAPNPTGSLEPTLAVFSAVAAYLRKIGEATPIVLAFRGADNLDRLSRDLLFFLAEQLANAPLFCLMFAREDVLQLRCDQTLRLMPLDRDRIRQQVALLLRGPIAEEALDHIARVSEGNAFQVAELVRILVARQSLSHDGRQWRLDSDALADAASVEDLFAEPLSRLEPRALGLLARASIQGSVFWDKALDLDLPPAQLDTTLDALVADDLLIARPSSRFPPARELGFRHDALQRRLYRDAPLAERRAAHARLARFILSTSPSGLGRMADLALAAHHASLGGDEALAGPLRMALADEASRWERPERGPGWFEWPASLGSAVFDL